MPKSKSKITISVKPQKNKKANHKGKKNGKRHAAGSASGSLSGRGKYTGKHVSLADSVASGAGWLVDTFLGPMLNGRGSYQSNGSIVGTDGPMQFQGSPDTVIRHREFLSDVTGSTAFNVASFLLNPTSPSLTPWLSNLAKCYDEYEWLGLLFEYRSTCSEVITGTNNAMGTVIMATDYNLANAPFTGKIDMENFENAVSCSPNHSFYHMVECKPRETTIETLYTVVDGNDIRFCALGNFQLATVGMQAAAVVGELWVTYAIKLKKPKLPTHAMSNDFIVFSSGGAGVTPANPVGGVNSLQWTGSFQRDVVTVTNPGVGQVLFTLADGTESTKSLKPGSAYMLYYQLTNVTLNTSVVSSSLPPVSGLAQYTNSPFTASFSSNDATSSSGQLLFQVSETNPAVPNPVYNLLLTGFGGFVPAATTRFSAIIVPLATQFAAPANNMPGLSVSARAEVQRLFQDMLKGLPVIPPSCSEEEKAPESDFDVPTPFPTPGAAASGENLTMSGLVSALKSLTTR